MHNDTLSATHSRNLKFLKSTIKKMDANLNNLSHMVHGELQALESSLNKVNGRKPARIVASKVGTGEDSGIFDQILGKYINPNESALTNAYRISKGQLFSDFASGLSKAMRRNM